MELNIISNKPEEITQENPLLFVHGAWHGSWCWEEYFIPYFANLGYECYALNFRGHGGSGNPKSLRFTTIGDYVEDLTEVIKHLEKDPIVIAHSMGAFVLQHYLTKNDVKGSVMLTPIPPWGVFRTTLKVAMKMPWSFLKANLIWNLGPIADSVGKVQKAFFSKNIDPVLLEKFANQMQDESYFAYLGMLFFSLPNSKKVNTKTLVIGGEDDFLFTPKQMTNTAKKYNTQPVMFEGMGHDIMLDKGWENVAGKVHQWIQNDLLSI